MNGVRIRSRFLPAFMVLIGTFISGCRSVPDKTRLDSPEYVAQAIQSLCILSCYEEAGRLYDIHLSQYDIHENYLSRHYALLLFSRINRSEEFFEYLKDYKSLGGAMPNGGYWVEAKFYDRHHGLIENVYQSDSVSHCSYQDNVMEEFMITDRNIRLNTADHVNIKILKDSINQISIKTILSKQYCVNYILSKAVRRLLRHCSPEYIIFLDKSGQLNDLFKRGVFNIEEFYDSFGYVTGKEYLPFYEIGDDEEIGVLNKRRDKAGLLPIDLSCYWLFRNGGLKIPEKSNCNSIKCEQLMMYLNES